MAENVQKQTFSKEYTYHSFLCLISHGGKGILSINQSMGMGVIHVNMTKDASIEMDSDTREPVIVSSSLKNTALSLSNLNS